MARTRYRWGEVISTRYMVQIDWAVLLLLAMLAVGLLRHIRGGELRQGVIVSAAFSMLFVLNFREQVWLFTTPASPEAVSHLEGAITPEACAYLQSEVGEGQILIAERADILRIHCGLNARAIPPTEDRSDILRRPMNRDVFDAALKSGLLWGVIINDRDAALRGEFGPVLRSVFEDPALGFTRIQSEDSVYILRYTGN